MYSEEHGELFCRRQMSADEYVLWSGRPEKRGLFFIAGDLHSIFFFIIFTVFSFVIFYAGLKGTPAGSPLRMIPIIFPTVGIGLLCVQVSKFLALRNKTEYVITNKRFYRRYGNKMENFPISQTAGYNVKYHRNGNASIVFTGIIDSTRPMVRSNGRQIIPYITISNIADVARVQQALDRANTEE